MSEINALHQLAHFQPSSRLASDDPAVCDEALRKLIRSLEPSKPVRHRVADLLSTVLALSARTRRMVMPRVNVDVDVFAPNGTRAVRIFFPENS